jgi:hypothetical protein
MPSEGRATCGDTPDADDVNFSGDTMAEEKPTLHIDTDWKKQAQEEKRRLAEQEKQNAPTVSTTAPAATPGVAASQKPEAARREMPEASFATLVSSFMTQALFYLGDLAPRGGEPVLNLDLAKHHIDMLGVLEQKTRGNLDAEEQRVLDTALYDLRMRYVSVASQYIT